MKNELLIFLDKLVGFLDKWFEIIRNFFKRKEIKKEIEESEKIKKEIEKTVDNKDIDDINDKLGWKN